MNIEELPDFAIVRELGQALWRKADLRGAAAMIGAGFTRNAQLPAPTSKGVPLWNEIAATMQAQLSIQAGAQGELDPLRLAEEYEAVLGRPALDALIRSQLYDDELLPGPLHNRLLGLPWSDIATTNFDTVLERAAAATPGPTYDIVRTLTDVPRTRSPRIIKLHGSLPSGPFTFTSEDYRAYPQTHTAFVNLVQQVMLENHLVLIGFSATDPNFLAWTGWIRDHIGSAARRVLLVGLLDLRLGARRVLEQRGVTPIDLSPLVSDVDGEYRHQRALEAFFVALEKAKPRPASEWRLGRIRESSVLDKVTKKATAERASEIVEEWRKDRLAYPGWLVAPSNVRFDLYSKTHAEMTDISAGIDALPVADRVQLLYELLWRFDTALRYPPAFVLKAAHRILFDGGQNDSLPADERIEIGIWCLRAAREDRDQANFERLSAWCRHNGSPSLDLNAAVAYENAVWAADGLEYDQIESLVEEIDGDDPTFCLRKAKLLLQIGAERRANELINEALAALRVLRTRDRSSIWVLSRYIWALFLARRAEAAHWTGVRRELDVPDQDERRGEHSIEWSSIHPLKAEGDSLSEEGVANQCDPLRMLLDFDNELYEAEVFAEQHRAPSALTPVQRYEPESNGCAGGIISRAAHRIGLPASFGELPINAARLDRALLLDNRVSGPQLLPLISLLRVPEGRLIERHLSRAAIAQLPIEFVQNALDRVLATIDALMPLGEYRIAHEGGRDFDTIDILVSTLTAVASRLVTRVDDDRALATAKRALGWSRSPRWHTLRLPKWLAGLIRWSIYAVPDRKHQELLVEFACYPTPSEIPQKLVVEEPEPSVWFAELKAARPETPLFASRIKQLLEFVKNGPDRTRAALRLLRLSGYGVLSSDENSALFDGVWARTDNFGLPVDLSLSGDTILAQFNTPDGRADRAFRKKMLDREINLSGELVNLLRVDPDWTTGEARCLRLTVPEARTCLDLAFAYKGVRDFSGGPSNYELDLGLAIVNGILPVLVSNGELDADLRNKLVRFLHSDIVFGACQAWPLLVRHNNELLSLAVEFITKCLVSAISHEVVQGLLSIGRWRRMRGWEKMPEIPVQLIANVKAMVLMRRPTALYSALRLLANLCRDGLVDNDGIGELVMVLPHLEKESRATERHSQDSPVLQSGAAVVIRMEAARLALVLADKGIRAESIDNWVKLIPHDPFPEVRRASING